MQMRRQPHLVRYPRVTLACGRIPIDPKLARAWIYRAQAGWLEQAEEVAGRGVLLLASATFLRKLLNHHRNREKVEFYDQVLTSCVKNMSVSVMRDAAAAAAELQSWGRLLIEEHVATITILTIMHACESRLSNT